MRFSDTIRFNANPNWWSFYVPYEDLKKSIARLRYFRNCTFVTINGVTAPSEPIPYQSREEEDSTDEEGDDDSEHTKSQTLRQHHPISSAPAAMGVAEPSQVGPVSPPNGDSNHGPGSPSAFVVLAQRNNARRSGPLEDLPHMSDDDDGDALLPHFPEIASPEDTQKEFLREEKHFFDRLHRISRRVNAFYKRLSEDVRKTSDEHFRRAERITLIRKNAHEGTPLIADSDDGQLLDEREMATFQSAFLKEYRQLSEVILYAHINLTAFEKILKKHDKVTGLNTKEAFLNELACTTRLHDTSVLDALQKDSVKIYSDLFRRGDMRIGKAELDNELRDLVFWERNTIWRNIVRNEKRGSSLRTVRGGRNFLEAQNKPVKLEVHPYKLVFAILLFMFLWSSPGILRAISGPIDPNKYPPNTVEAANRCFAILALAVALWAPKAIPLYVTSFVICAGCILCQVFTDPATGIPVSAHDASKKVFSSLSSPTLILILAVYALGAGLSKYDIDKQIASMLLVRFSHKAEVLLLALMVISVFVSMLVSNVASPILMHSVLKPTIETMQMSQLNKKYIQCVLLGVMVACNVGGFASPIASPQSAIALGLLVGENKISFLSWLAVSIPLCVIMVLIFYSVLRVMYQPEHHKVPQMNSRRMDYRWWHWGVVITFVVSIAMWMIHWFAEVFGSSGMVGVVPLIALFGTGILTKADFNNLSWDVVALVAGGSVLGKAVESSKLLDLMSQRVQSLGYVWLTFTVLCILVGTLANFVSHTVSAVILLPLFLKVGEDLGHPQMFVVGGTIAASCAMATNVSSFPNIQTSGFEDETGEAIVTNSELISIGSVMTATAMGVLVTAGYALMTFLVH